MTSIYDAELLLVDDNPDLLRLLCEQLSGAGYHHIRTAATCAAARAAFDAAPPHLMVLDINLPDGDGFTLLQSLRRQADVPALFLSARDADGDRLFGLGLGADDYLTKPFLMQELLLRMRTILRRTYRESPDGMPLALGGCVVLPGESAVLRDGQRLSLTATERRLLLKLCENRGRIVTFDALCESVWGNGYYVYENSLNVHIRHLREKLEADPSHPRLLLTVRGLGYRLTREDER